MSRPPAAIAEAVDHIEVDEDLPSEEERIKKAIAEAKLEPEFRAALSLSRWGDHDDTSLIALIEAFKNSMQADDDGTRTLRTQADVLDALFHKLVTLALQQKPLAAIESLMKLALKAQVQSRRTAEALATIKNPANVFAKQVNVGNNVQVNNGSESQKNSQKAPNEVSSEHEPRTEPRAIEENSSMETVGAFHWPQDAERQIARVEERF